MKKYFIVLFLVILIFPSVAFASWWNPFTWKIFQKKEVVPLIQNEEQKISDTKINELQKQINDLKSQQPNSTTPTKTKVNPVIKRANTVFNFPAGCTSASGFSSTTGLSCDGVTISTKDITPYVDLKVNGQDGPITIKINSVANVSWTSKNVTSCGSSTIRPLNGTEKIYIDAGTNNPFVLNCFTSSGTLVSDSVVLNIIGDTSKNIDPYNVSSGSGIQYSPDQLNSIDCAYYGTNCPTLHIKIDN